MLSWAIFFFIIAIIAALFWIWRYCCRCSRYSKTIVLPIYYYFRCITVTRAY